ncbi:ankyrin repeat domain-containing protein [bacterium CPR1]|nr:ankyrin repeat domain-containing protein [bacterium CPR1]
MPDWSRCRDKSESSPSAWSCCWPCNEASALRWGQPSTAIPPCWLTGIRGDGVHWATFFGCEDMVRALLEGGAVWTGPERDGSAMHIAVRWNRLKVLEEMLRAGLTLDDLDETGATPLLLAAMLGRLSVAEALIRGQADPNRPDRSGRLPLLEAVSRRRLGMVASLIAAGAKVNARGPDGQTALHLATRLGLAEMVECLLLNGGRADQPDASGQTVLALARQRRHRGVLQALRRHAASGLATSQA